MAKETQKIKKKSLNIVRIEEENEKDLPIYLTDLSCKVLLEGEKHIGQNIQVGIWQVVERQVVEVDGK